jgi:hypothetical protein
MFNNAAAGQVGNFLVGSSQSSLVPAPFGDDVFSITSRLLNVNIGGVAAGYRLAAEEFMRDKRPGIIVTVGLSFFPRRLGVEANTKFSIADGFDGRILSRGISSYIRSHKSCRRVLCEGCESFAEDERNPEHRDLPR